MTECTIENMNRVELDGVEYVTVTSPHKKERMRINDNPCIGCIADHQQGFEMIAKWEMCRKLPSCAAHQRPDNRNVMWVAANARPHAEARSADSVQADVGPTFSTGKYRGYVCDACGEEFPHETSRDVHFRRAQRGLGCRANAGCVR